MNVECKLRELRGDRSLKQLERDTGINRGALSRYERGREFPPERDVPILERHYGAPYATWYPKTSAPAVRPHRERKPATGVRITLQPDELELLRLLLALEDTPIAIRVSEKVYRARARVKS